MAHQLKIAVIGGSGFYRLEQLQGAQERVCSTPWGPPSGPIIEGTIGGVEVAMLSRHGAGHVLAPGEVNYRANIAALKELGCTHILAVTACGSLKDEISPGTFVLLDSFIDRTQGRAQTFYGPGGWPGVCHAPMEPAFCERTRSLVEQACSALGYKVVNGGTMVTIQGPRFSSRAESKMFQLMGGDVVNMTTVPEVCLAKEAGISYTSIALATDYDCWKDHNLVDTQSVLKVLADNVSRVKQLIVETVGRMAGEDWAHTIHTNRTVAQNSVIGGSHT